MSFFSRQRMNLSWRDPQRGLLHVVSKIVSTPIDVRRVWYKTACGLQLSVDDVNARTMMNTTPSCLSCVVAVPEEDVIKGKE